MYPGPLTKMYREILDHMINDGWAEFCRFIRDQPPDKIHDLLENIMKTNINVTPGQLTLNDVYWSINLARLNPVVEYIVDADLANALVLSELPNGNITVGEAFALPYQAVSIKKTSDSKNAYTLYAIDGPDLIAISGNGRAQCSPLAQPMSEIYIRSNGVDTTGFRTQLGILMYLTHGEDIEEERILRKGSSKKNRNRDANLEVVRGVVGGKFASALKRWQKTKEGGGDGTHASPRPHCRAGHWHLYWTGKGRTIPRVQFLHPCLVNADSVGDVEIQRTVAP